MEHILPLCCYFIYNWVLFAQKYSLLSTLQRTASTVSCSQQWCKKASDENPNSIVVAETMKLLRNSSYGYQITDRSRHTVTKYLSDTKTHAAIKSKLFKKLDHVNNSLYEVELAKASIEHKEPIVVRFFILQYAKLRMLELYYNFFIRLCDVNKLED